MFPETKTDSSLRIVFDGVECRLARHFMPQKTDYGVMYVLFSGEKTTVSFPGVATLEYSDYHYKPLVGMWDTPYRLVRPRVSHISTGTPSA